MIEKRGVLIGLVFVVLLLGLNIVSAVGVSLSSINATLSTVSISGAVDLYAYEVNLDYGGNTGQVTFYNFLASDGASTSKGSATRNNILSAYESRLDPNQEGISGSGNLFDVAHSGSISLRYALFIAADGSEEYVYYNASVSGGSSGSGGGGGSGSTGSGPLVPFSVDKTKIEVDLKQGETKTETLTITNDANNDLPFKVSFEGLNGYLILDDTSFTLPAGQSKTVNADFFVPETETPNVYTGRINIESGSSRILINVILEIIERQPLFDITMKLNKDEFLKSGEIEAKIKMTNIGDFDKVDVNLEYSIKDFEDFELMLRGETVGVNGDLEIERRFSIPESLSEGDYVFIVKLTDHDGKIATSVYPFKILEGTYSPPFFKANLVYLAAAGLVLVLVLLVILLAFVKKKNKRLGK